MLFILWDLFKDGENVLRVGVVYFMQFDKIFVVYVFCFLFLFLIFISFINLFVYVNGFFNFDFLRDYVMQVIEG